MSLQPFWAGRGPGATTHRRWAGEEPPERAHDQAWVLWVFLADEGPGGARNGDDDLNKVDAELQSNQDLQLTIVLSVWTKRQLVFPGGYYLFSQCSVLSVLTDCDS